VPCISMHGLVLAGNAAVLCIKGTSPVTEHAKVLQLMLLAITCTR